MLNRIARSAVDSISEQKRAADLRLALWHSSLESAYRHTVTIEDDLDFDDREKSGTEKLVGKDFRVGMKRVPCEPVNNHGGNFFPVLIDSTRVFFVLVPFDR